MGEFTTEGIVTPQPEVDATIKPEVTMNPDGTGGKAVVSFDQVKEAQAQAATEAPPVPEWLKTSGIPAEHHASLSKFNSVEDMAASYSALQSKMGQPGQSVVTGDETITSQAPAGRGPQGGNLNIDHTMQGAADRSFIERAGFNEKELVDSFNANGSLTPEQIQKLQGAGASLKDIEQGINGRVAQNKIAQMQADLMMKEAGDLVGGEDHLQSVLDWARDNVPEAEKDAINAQLLNPASFKRAVQHLSRDMAEATGTANMSQPISGSNAAAAAVNPFGTMQEMSAAMMDKRFDKDKVYTAGVLARAKITNSKRLPQ